MAPSDRDRDRRNPPRADTPSRGVPRDFLGPVRDDDLTPVSSILRLEGKLDDHSSDDQRAISGVHESIRALDTRLTLQVTGLDTRLSQQITDVGSVQSKLLSETAGQTVMLESAIEKWDDDRRARAVSAEKSATEATKAATAATVAAEKATEVRIDRRTKLMIAIVGIVGSLLTAVVVHEIEHNSSSPERPAIREAPEP